MTLYRPTVAQVIGVYRRCTEGELIAETGRSAADVFTELCQLEAEHFIEWDDLEGEWCLFGTADLGGYEVHEAEL